MLNLSALPKDVTVKVVQIIDGHKIEQVMINNDEYINCLAIEENEIQIQDGQSSQSSSLNDSFEAFEARAQLFLEENPLSSPISINSESFDDSNFNDGETNSEAIENDRESMEKQNVIRLELPSHRYFEGKRLTALDQCQFLNSVLEHRAWSQVSGWNKVRDELKFKGSAETLRKTFLTYIQKFKQDRLKSLRGSGLEEERCLRRTIMEEIDNLMRDEQFERHEENLRIDNNSDDENETPRSSLDDEVWTAKRIRENALKTLKDKCGNESTKSQIKIGKRTKLSDIAETIRLDQERNRGLELKLEKKKIKLEEKRLKFETKKQKSQDRIALAQVQALQASTTAVLEIGKYFATNRNRQ